METMFVTETEWEVMLFPSNLRQFWLLYRKPVCYSEHQELNHSLFVKDIESPSERGHSVDKVSLSGLFRNPWVTSPTLSNCVSWKTQLRYLNHFELPGITSLGNKAFSSEFSLAAHNEALFTSFQFLGNKNRF